MSLSPPAYDCVAQGSAAITITLAFPPYQPLQWAWTKLCGQSLPDISVGTTPTLEDVVSDGSATLMWNPVLHTAFVNGGTPVSNFWVRVASNLSRSDVLVHRISAFARNSSICTPVVRGHLAQHGGTINATAVLFAVEYNCTADGRSVIDVIIDVQDPFYAIKFSWLKRNNAGREGFQIGTSPHASDVVENGQVSPTWDPLHYTAFFPSWIHTAVLYIGMSDKDFTPQLIRGVSIDTDGRQICSPKLGGALERNQNGTLVDYSHNRTLHIVFNCSAQGHTTMFINFTLANFPMIRIAFTKFYGGHRHYFRIGTVPGFNDVVDDGYSLPMWLPGGPLNKEMVLGNANSTSFYLSMSLPGETQLFGAIQFFTDVDTPGMYNPVLTGNAMNGSIARYFNGSSMQPIENLRSFTVEYNCAIRGLAFIQITILIDPFEPIAFGWRKDCGVHLHGFEVGTTINGTDVVSGGHVTYAWNRFAHVAFVFGSAQYTTFHFIVRGTEPQVLQNITVSASSGICNPYILLGSLQPGDMITNNTRAGNVTVVYNCAVVGRTNITVTVDLGSVFDPLVFVWTKRVGGSRDYFSIGSKPGLSDIAENGLATLQWDRRFHTAYVPTNTTFVSFWCFVSKSSKDPFLQSQIVLPPKVKILAPGVFARAFGVFQNGPYNLQDIPVNMTVGHECLLAGNWTIDLSLPLVAFDPIRLAWTKECPPNVFGLTVMHYEQLVVKDGLALEKWSLANHTAFAGPDNFNDTFTSSWTPTEADPAASLILAEVAIVVEPSDFCTVALSGPLMNSYALRRDPQAVSLFFNCTRPGTMNVTVLLILDQFSRSSTAFSFTKSVGGPRLGFSVSSSRGNITAEDVVQNGATAESWSIANSLHQTGLNTNKSPFMIFMDSNSTSYPFQSFTAISLSVEPSNGICNAFVGGPAALGATAGPISTPIELLVLYECTDIGVFNVTASFNVTAFDPVEFTWTKASNGHRLGLNVDAPAAPERGFVSVVANGAVTAPWKTSVEAVEFGQDHMQIMFSFSADGTQLAPTQSIIVQRPSISLNSTFCVPILSGPLANGAAIPTHEAQSLTVDLSPCAQIQADLIVQINVGLAAYRNISFGFIWRRATSLAPVQAGMDTSKTIFIGLAIGFGALFLITVIVLVWRRFRRQSQSEYGSLAPEYQALIVNADEPDPQ